LGHEDSDDGTTARGAGAARRGSGDATALGAVAFFALGVGTGGDPGDLAAWADGGFVRGAGVGGSGAVFHGAGQAAGIAGGAGDFEFFGIERADLRARRAGPAGRVVLFAGCESVARGESGAGAL